MASVVLNSPYVKRNNVKTNVAWSANIVKFTDGEDLQAKLNTGKLSGSTASEITTTNNSNVQQELDDIKNSLENYSPSQSLIASIPTIRNLTYNGSEQTVFINNFDSNAMTKSGDVTVTEPGEYSITVALRQNWKWSDGTNSAKTITFNVNKKTPSLTGTPSSLTLNTDTPTGTITYITDSDGTLSVTSTDSSVASVSLNGSVATVTGLSDGTATIQGSVTASTYYSASSILSTPISVSLFKRIGLLWDGSGFYRVDEDLNIISDSNFDPATTFPYSEMSTETIDGVEGVTWPVMYAHAENAASKNATYGRVWWIDSAPSSDNHVCPSFVDYGTTKNKLWLKTTLESTNLTYHNLCTKTANTVMNCYDYALMQKLILIEYSTGTNRMSDVLAADTTWRNLQKAWGHNYQWIFGIDMLKSGSYSATLGDGTLRILNPTMDGTFIDTDLSPSYRWIKGNFNIGNVNGINMGDFMFDTSSESSNGNTSPFSQQRFSSGYAFHYDSVTGFLGLASRGPNDSDTWRLRKVL